MSTRSRQRWLFAGAVAAYLLIGLEVLIMVTPFALFFYSVYGPVLDFLASSPLTSWTAEFFLPHMVFVPDPLLLGLSYLQILFVFGLVLFLAAAVPLYWSRLRGRGVVSFGFYSFCRHPQYLFLAVSGFGLLLYWPRFIILISYVTLLFVYYLLARNEEWRMQRERPTDYQAYMSRTPMFFPGEPGGKAYRRLLGWMRPRWLGMLSAYLLALSIAILAGLGLRSYTVAHLPKADAGGTMLVSVYPRPAEKILGLFERARQAEKIRRHLSEEEVPLVYLMPGDYFLTGLLLTEGPRFSPQALERFPELADWEKRRLKGGLGKFFRLFYKYYDTLGTARTVYDIERLVLVRVSDAEGRPLPPAAAFAMGARRTPTLVVDMDFETGEVLAVVSVSGSHVWGRMPMPAF